MPFAPLLIAATIFSQPAISVNERGLAGAINTYRRERGLPAVPYSPGLEAVARAHVWDLENNRPDDATDSPTGWGRCNMHSWSARGRWTPVCYTGDQRQASAMWSKPREITRGAYSGAGYEIAFWISDGLDPEVAIEGWISSPAHDQVLREAGMWRGSRWQAMGVAIAGHYAVAWFGKEPDMSRAQLRSR